MPKELLDKVLAASKFNQGFATTEYLGAAMLDQRWHQAAADQLPDAKGVMAFEAAALKADGVDYAPVPPRYRTHLLQPHHGRLRGGLLRLHLVGSARRQQRAVVQAARRPDPRERRPLPPVRCSSRAAARTRCKLFPNFAGHEPKIEPLLEKRGLTGGKGAAASEKAAKK